MNPVLIILILLGAAVLWAILSFIFLPLGKIVSKFFKNIIKQINK